MIRLCLVQLPLSLLGATAVLAAGLALAGCGPAADRPEPADLVLRNGNIVTLDEANPPVDALAIRDGTVVATGTA